MTATARDDVTRWLRAWSRGNEEALEKLMPLVYRELHRRARRFIVRERTGHTLQATALIHEAYLRLVGARTDWRDRGHFYALSSRLMRQILVDHARTRGRQKRGGAAAPISFDEAAVMAPVEPPDLVRLDDALRALAETDKRKSDVVELRFFGGLTAEETADVLRVSPQTVLRDWRLAKAWLQREMTRSDRGRH
jgi:RNA polymerase sigma-70 factor (ECF subfamily)